MQRSSNRTRLGKDLFSKLVLVTLGAASLGLLVAGGWSLLKRSTSYTVALGAGAKEGDSFILSSAIEPVVERYYPNIDIQVIETGGTSDNLDRLEANEIQLATAQADVSPGERARTVAILYPDKALTIVNETAPIQSFSDLRGKTIALPTSGGQYRTFLDIAAHYNLDAGDFTFVGEDDGIADNLFFSGQANAVFRIRSLSNPNIEALMLTGQNRLVPLDQGAALRIKYPALEPTTIPEGTFRGTPPLPAQDLPTVEIQRLLLARDSLPNEVVAALANVLIDHRQEIMKEVPEHILEVRPLVTNFRDPRDANRILAPIHEGAADYYNRDQPSFIQENADYLALILTVVLLLGSWLWELKKIVEARQKNNGDVYTENVLQLMEQVNVATKYSQTEEIRRQLRQTLSNAVADLDQDRLSEESFQSFRVVWQIVMDVAREREQKLKNEDNGLTAKVLQVMEQVPTTRDYQEADTLRLELQQILTHAVTALNEDQISRDAFQSFRVVWQIAMDEVRSYQHRVQDPVVSPSRV